VDDKPEFDKTYDITNLNIYKLKVSPIDGTPIVETPVDPVASVSSDAPVVAVSSDASVATDAAVDPVASVATDAAVEPAAPAVSSDFGLELKKPLEGGKKINKSRKSINKKRTFKKQISRKRISKRNRRSLRKPLSRKIR
jgi:hypothetical protein